MEVVQYEIKYYLQTFNRSVVKSYFVIHFDLCILCDGNHFCVLLP